MKSKKISRECEGVLYGKNDAWTGEEFRDFSL